MRFFYNLLLPLGLLFYVPGLWWKYKHRPGYKATFPERFGVFSDERKRELAQYARCIWVHAVSVGETVLALNLIKEALREHPDWKFVLSTSTTTGQEVARKETIENLAVIYSPVDFFWLVDKLLNLIKPRLVVIMETEIWPNMIWRSVKRDIKVILCNARLSDKSARGYRRARWFFRELFESFDLILAQSRLDAERFLMVAPMAKVELGGNLKFDQKIPEVAEKIDYVEIFGAGSHRLLLAASTHPGEEKLLAATFLELRKKYPDLRLVIVPRHAERGAEVAQQLTELNISFQRRSSGEKTAQSVDVLLADTTGEMLKFISDAEVVFVGKSLAGHDEGHNLIEPAAFGKIVVTGSVLRNFRQMLQVLDQAQAVVKVASDAELLDTLDGLFADPESAAQYGKRAQEAIMQNSGALKRSVEEISKRL